MAAPFLLGLSARARRASPIIRRAVREGISSRALTGILQKAGLGLRRQTLLDIMRLVEGEIAIGPVLSALGVNRLPNPLRLPPALTKIRRAFSFTVRVRGLDADTGATIERFVTIATDTVLTRGELEELAADAIDRGQDRYKLSATEFLLTGGLRTGTPGVF